MVDGGKTGERVGWQKTAMSSENFCRSMLLKFKYCIIDSCWDWLTTEIDLKHVFIRRVDFLLYTMRLLNENAALHNI